MRHLFPIVDHEVDFCVVGGGIAGLCAAVSAARHGLRVVLMHERPVLGGNASSEIRMWICGAGDEWRETGILEELAMENARINSRRLYPMWDAVLYGIVAAEKNITLLLNCSCMDGEAENGVLRSVTGWQMTTQQFHRVRARLFADCSGDSILAPISGAERRTGREAADEYGESLAQAETDGKTMGMSCLLQARETPEPRSYTPPAFAHRFDEKTINRRIPNPKNPFENYWYLELSGEDPIGDTEKTRDELLRIAYGVWDFVKNQRSGNENFELDWLGYLPGKRESRRYIGDVVLTQRDLEGGGAPFADVVAYGGWPMDDHPPEGFYAEAPPNRNAGTARPYGIPFRALYSRNIGNLLFAGRNISVSHVALTSTRVMATCGLMGQAVGTAAAIAVAENCTPREIAAEHIGRLQQTLMEDDCFLPGMAMAVGALTRRARLTGSVDTALENLRNGQDRAVGGSDNGWSCPLGGWFEYAFEEPTDVGALRIVFDSYLTRGCGKHMEERYTTKANTLLGERDVGLPETLVSNYDLVITGADGMTRRMEYRGNARRLVVLPIDMTVLSVRVELLETYGARTAHVFSATLKPAKA